MLKMWFVDDRHENWATWLNSFPAAVKAENEFLTFESIDQMTAYSNAGHHPDIVFIDFFVNGAYGLRVIEHFRHSHGWLPLLIAHSSMNEANEALLAAGAHLKMEKVKGVAATASIVEAIKSSDDLVGLLKFRDENDPEMA